MSGPAVWVALDPRMSPHELGFLPDIIRAEDPRPVKEQLATNYAHGGGYRPFDGFKLDRKTMVLKYPGDPPFKPIAFAQINAEKVFFYRQGAWLLIMQPDDTWVVTRVD